MRHAYSKVMASPRNIRILGSIFICAGIFYGHTVQAQARGEFSTNFESIQKEVRALNDLKEEHLNPLSPYLQIFHQNHTRPVRYRSIDLTTLEALSLKEPSTLYELLPTPSLFREMKPSKFNLYVNENALLTPFRLDLRVSSKITLETKTNFLNASIIAQPLQKRMSLGLSRTLFEHTTLQAFVNPVSLELLGLLTHEWSRDLQLLLLYYYDPHESRNDVIASLKFLF
jgi:hypothetical protein